MENIPEIDLRSLSASLVYINNYLYFEDNISDSINSECESEYI